MQKKRLLKIIGIGLIVACQMALASCASECVQTPASAIPDYILTPCEFPPPRDINTNEDLLDLTTDFYNALSVCADKHSLMVKYIGGLYGDGAR